PLPARRVGAVSDRSSKPPPLRIDCVVRLVSGSAPPPSSRRLRTAAAAGRVPPPWGSSRGPHAIRGARRLSAGAPRTLRGLGAISGPLTQSGGARRLRRRAPNVGGVGGQRGPLAIQRSATAPPARSERRGGWRPAGPSRNPEERDGSAGA